MQNITSTAQQFKLQTSQNLSLKISLHTCSLAVQKVDLDLRDVPTEILASSYRFQYPNLWISRHQVPIQNLCIKNTSLHISFDFLV